MPVMTGKASIALGSASEGFGVDSNMMEFISKPFGVLMELIYDTLAFENYGIAIILFTLVVRIIMLPLNVKQQKGMARQQALMPEIDALKVQYKDDPKKLQEEQAALFSRHHINPYSGCLPTLIQFPLILALYRIIRMPLTYIAGLSSQVIASLAEVVNTSADNEILINDYFLTRASELVEGVTQSDLINMKFLRIFDLGVTPDWKFWSWGDGTWKTYLPLLLLPVLAVVTSYIQQFATMRLSGTGKKDKKSGDASSNAMNGMMKFMPLMTLFFAFILPAGLSFYWTVSNVIGIGQTYLIKRVFTRRKKEGSV